MLNIKSMLSDNYGCINFSMMVIDGCSLYVVWSYYIEDSACFNKIVVSLHHI